MALATRRPKKNGRPQSKLSFIVGVEPEVAGIVGMVPASPGYAVTVLLAASALTT
jgi:hypothetical protein